jgi:histidine triad (HIT) family protein
MPRTCSFCDVLAGHAAGPPIAYEDDAHVVFINRHQVTGPGSALVVTRAHVADLHDLADDSCGTALRLVRSVSVAVQSAFGVSSTTVIQNNGHPAQSVPHLHFHVVPRRPGDGLLAKSERPEPEHELTRQAGRLREAMLVSDR